MPPAKKIQVGLRLPDARHKQFIFPIGMVFDETGFYRWLNKANSTRFWVMTYTATPYAELPRIDRLLLSRGHHAAAEIRYLEGIHTKLVIQHLGEFLVGVYIGSMNLVDSRAAELMVTVPFAAWKVLVEYFEWYWKQGKVINATDKAKRD